MQRVKALLLALHCAARRRIGPHLLRPQDLAAPCTNVQQQQPTVIGVTGDEHRIVPDDRRAVTPFGQRALPCDLAVFAPEDRHGRFATDARSSWTAPLWPFSARNCVPALTWASAPHRIHTTIARRHCKAPAGAAAATSWSLQARLSLSVTVIVLSCRIARRGERFGGPQDRLLDIRCGHNSTRETRDGLPPPCEVTSRITVPSSHEPGLGNAAKDLTARRCPILRAKRSLSLEPFADYVRLLPTVSRRKPIFP